MKAKLKPEDDLVKLTIGWHTMAIPRALAYQVHAALSQACKVENLYLDGKQYAVLSQADSAVVSELEQALDLTDVASDTERNRYIEAVKAAATLAGAGYTPVTYKEWKEAQNGQG